MKEISKVTEIEKSYRIWKWVLKFQCKVLPIEISSNTKFVVQSIVIQNFMEFSSISTHRAHITSRQDPTIMVIISSEPSGARSGDIISKMYSQTGAK